MRFIALVSGVLHPRAWLCTCMGHIVKMLQVFKIPLYSWTSRKQTRCIVGFYWNCEIHGPWVYLLNINLKNWLCSDYEHGGFYQNCEIHTTGLVVLTLRWGSMEHKLKIHYIFSYTFYSWRLSHTLHKTCLWLDNISVVYKNEFNSIIFTICRGIYLTCL